MKLKKCSYCQSDAVFQELGAAAWVDCSRKDCWSGPVFFADHKQANVNQAVEHWNTVMIRKNRLSRKV